MNYEPRKITKDLLRQMSRARKPETPKEIRDSARGIVLRHQPSGYMAIYAQLGRGKRERLCGDGEIKNILDEHHPLTFSSVLEQAKVVHGQSAQGRDFAGERKAERAVPNLSDFLKEEYGPWVLKPENMKDGQGQIDRIKACFEKPFGKLKLTDIDKRRVKKWRSGRTEDVDAQTVNRDLTSLSGLLNYAVDDEVIPVHPFKGLKPLKVNDDRIVRALERDEERRLREVLKARDDKKRAARASRNRWARERGYPERPAISTYADRLMPAVLISLETGLRQNELFSLDWRFVDFKKKNIHVHWKTAKTDHARVIPMNPCALEVMRAWWMQNAQPNDGLVFPGAKGKLSSLKTSYHAVLKTAKIPRVNAMGLKVDWHSLRHCFGTRLSAKNVDPVTIQKLMGHQSLETTMRYLHSEPDRMRAAVEQLVS